LIEIFLSQISYFIFFQLYVATSPKVEGVSGEYFVPIAIMTKASSQGTNATLGEILWEESERLTKPFW
jgi:hypothetical protein